MRSRTIGEIVSALSTAAFLLIDLIGLGSGAAWQVLALVSFIVFVGLVTWQIGAQDRQIHRPERGIDLAIRPDHLIDGQWFRGAWFTDVPGRSNIWASFYVDIINADSTARTVNELYLECWSIWEIPVAGWGWRRRLIRISHPQKIDHELDWYKRQAPSRVDWSLAPASGTYTHRLYFDDTWDANDEYPKLPAKFDLYVVLEVGGRQHKRRWLVVRDR